MKKYLPLLLLILILSCKKDVDKASQLLSKSWKMTAWIVLTPLQGTPLDGTSQNWMGTNPCFSDKIQTFKSDGTFIQEKATTCINDDEYDNTWILSDC